MSDPETNVPPTETGAVSESASSSQETKDPIEAAKWSAVADEREKRRQAVERAEKLEQEVAYMRGQLEASRQPPPEPEKDPNQAFLEDPAGFVVSQVKGLRAEMEDREWKSLVRIDSSYVRRQHEDFDAKAKEFAQLAQTDPALLHQFRNSEAPAHFAYEYMKKQEEVKKYGSAEKLRDAIEAEVLEKLRRSGAIADASKVPPSIADKGQAGSGSGPPKKMRAVDEYYSRKPF
jgi:hypothetical protein